MGWLRWNCNKHPNTISDISFEGETVPATSKQDSLQVKLGDAILQDDRNERENKYSFQPTSLSSDELPFIPSDVVQSAKSDPKKLWIVIDEIVFDCTDFVLIHPGGNTVIESFHGEDCSWQFWRFHNRSIMEMDGRPLRIGRTTAIANRFKEKPRFVGLRRLGVDDD